MNRRITALVLAAGLFIPFTALADASADGLGPATSSTGGTSSSADGSALQPAGTSTLQSNNAGSDGLSSSSSDAATLQQPATADNSQLQVLLGNDADGTTHSTGGTSAWWYALWIAVALVLIGFGAWLWRRQNRQPKFNPFEIVPSATESADETAESTELTTEPTTEDSETAEEVAPESDEEALSEATEADVQTDEEPPLIVGESDEKTGDDGAQHPQPNRKKGRRKRSSRSRH